MQTAATTSLVLAPLCRSAIGAMVLALVTGFHYVTLQTNGIVLVGQMVPEARLRATALGLMCSALPAAQLIVGAVAGPISHAFHDDFGWWFTCIGALSAATTIVAWGIDARYSLIQGPKEVGWGMRK